jgi:DegV family protein with EDD domain
MGEMIRVVTDSSCDLPAHVLEEFEIEVVPLTVHFGTEVYSGGVLSLEEFWDKAAGPQYPSTSHPPVGAFEEVFEQIVGQGGRAVCVTLTGKHSGTFNSAQVAAQRFGEAVQIFDSLSLSLGLGWQAVSAAQAARAGHSMREILTMLEELRDRTRLLIVLDTLENLRHGGRAAAFISVVDRMTRVLDIKVITNVVEGQLRLLSAARSFKGALKRVFGAVERMGSLEHLGVVHTRNQSLAEQVAEQLAQRIGFPEERIWLAETGPALASHAGPGVIGVTAVPVPTTSVGPS